MLVNYLARYLAYNKGLMNVSLDYFHHSLFHVVIKSCVREMVGLGQMMQPAPSTLACTERPLT